MKPFLIAVLMLISYCMEAQVPRLVAVSYGKDSLRFYYSEDRGLSALNGNFIYDSLYVYNSKKFTGAAYFTYDTSDNVLTSRYNGVLDTQSKEVITYDTNNRIIQSVLTEEKDGKPFQQATTNYRYDSEGNLSRMLIYLESIVFGTDFRMQVYEYDNNGNLVVFHQKYADDTLNTTFSDFKYLYSYDQQNRMVELVSQKPGDIGWDSIKRQTYEYDANGDIVLTMIINIGNNNEWNIGGKRIYKYDAQHNKTTELYYTVTDTGYLLLESGSWTYTSFNKIQTASKIAHGFSRYDTTYYYEMHWPVQDCRLKVYPNPASSFINMETKCPEPRAFTISIYDIQGRVVKRWDEAATRKYKRTVSVDDLATGNYIIKLSGGIEDIQRFVITR